MREDVLQRLKNKQWQECDEDSFPHLTHTLLIIADYYTVKQ